MKYEMGQQVNSCPLINNRVTLKNPGSGKMQTTCHYYNRCIFPTFMNKKIR